MLRRWRYRRAMWHAIQEAAGNERPVWSWANKIHPINGLRAIRDFERVNGIPFDPLDSYHRDKIRDAGRYRAHLSLMRVQVAKLGVLVKTAEGVMGAIQKITPAQGRG
jgi:hypothetical protein